jgi:hypothetical protein
VCRSGRRSVAVEVVRRRPRPFPLRSTVCVKAACPCPSHCFCLSACLISLVMHQPPRTTSAEAAEAIERARHQARRQLPAMSDGCRHARVTTAGMQTWSDGRVDPVRIRAHADVQVDAQTCSDCGRAARVAVMVRLAGVVDDLEMEASYSLVTWMSI